MRHLPNDAAYLDKAAGFNDCVYLRHKILDAETAFSDPAFSRLHYFLSSDIPGKVRPGFKKLMNEGKNIIESPTDFA